MVLRLMLRLALGVMTILALADLTRALSVPADTQVQTPYGPVAKCGD